MQHQNVTGTRNWHDSAMTRFLPVGILAIGILLYAAFGHPSLPIVRFELAGDAKTALDVVDGRTGQFRDALLVDWFAFIPAYAIALSLAARNAGRARVGILLALAAAACDVVENAFLWHGLSDPTDRSFALATGFAIAKFVIVVPAIVVAVGGLRRRSDVSAR